LLFRHVLEGTKASGVESLCVRILTFCTQFFANISDFFKKNNFFLPSSLRVTGRVPLDVGNCDFNKDILTNFGLHGILLFLSLLQTQVAVVVHAKVLARSHFNVGHLSLAHLKKSES